MSKPTKQLSLRKLQWKLFLLGFFKIPMIGFLRPRLLSIDPQKVRLKIRLRRKSENHLKSMYFGALAVGADLSAGIHVFYFSEMESKKISFSFKGMNATFLKRAETDVIFECNQGQLIQSAISDSTISGERIHQTISVKALNTEKEIVATFDMIASIKVIPT
jgi:hypothetical protein